MEATTMKLARSFLMSFPAIFGLSAEVQALPSDEIFASGFEPVGYPVPLASPEDSDFIYTAQVTVGNQNFAMEIDTGSATLGVAGTACTSCTGTSPRYAPSSSAINTGNTASTEYADGSGWSGPVFSDTADLGNGSPPVSLDIVDISQSNQFFDGSNDYQGILGLGPQLLADQNTNAYIPAIVGAGVDDMIAFELCSITGANAGTMWIGGDGAAESAQYTPLLPITASNPFYAINVDALGLGNMSVVSNASNTFKQTVLATGTSFTYVPSSVYAAFKDKLASSAEFHAVFGSNTLSASGCVTDASVTEEQIDSELPSISFSLPNASSSQPDVTIQASALHTYFFNAGGGQYCLAIQNGGAGSATFGIAFMQAFHVVIDVAGGRVGFSEPTTCVATANRSIRHPASNG